MEFVFSLLKERNYVLLCVVFLLFQLERLGKGKGKGRNIIKSNPEYTFLILGTYLLLSVAKVLSAVDSEMQMHAEKNSFFVLR